MIQFYIDTSPIGEIVGFVEGMADAFNNPAFLDKLARIGHNRASFEFDVAAAAAANAGYLSHVYEYGTPGITEGASRFSDPTSPAARLWVHNLSGSGGQYDAQFAFRPATARNPARTTGSTGIPSKYLKKISRRKYVFRQRARLMEYGGEVEIKPKDGGRFLFVPSTRDPRGFVMWDAEAKGRGINMTLGENTAGTFTAFWEGWWGGEGQNVIDRAVDLIAESGTQEEWREMVMRARPGTPKPPTMATAEMLSAEAKSKSKTEKGLVMGVQRKAGRERR